MAVERKVGYLVNIFLRGRQTTSSTYQVGVTDDNLSTKVVFIGLPNYANALYFLKFNLDPMAKVLLNQVGTAYYLDLTRAMLQFANTCEVQVQIESADSPDVIVWQSFPFMFDLADTISDASIVIEQAPYLQELDMRVAKTARDAENSAGLAATSATNAANSAAEAATSEVNASASAASALASANSASTSATSALDSKNSASASAADAAASAVEAGQRAAAAKISEENAQASAAAAGNSADTAAASATSAAGSATSAAGSATAAQASADSISTADMAITMLAPSAAPTAELTKSATGVSISLGVPRSNIAYATFDISTDSGHMIMCSPEGYDGAEFELNENGHLEVII